MKRSSIRSLMVGAPLIAPWWAPAAEVGLSLNNVIQAQVVATRVKGVVEVSDGKDKGALRDKQPVKQGATINTGADSDVVLVFSNGVTASVAADSALTIKQFLQDPYAATINVATRESEPTVSKTELRFERGAIVVYVKYLSFDRGSTFQIETPAGTIGVRGTILRAKITPTGADTAEFRLESMSGVVVFSPKSGPVATILPGQPYLATIPWTK